MCLNDQGGSLFQEKYFEWPLVESVQYFAGCISDCNLSITILLNGDTQNVKLASFRENVYHTCFTTCTIVCKAKRKLFFL